MRRQLTQQADETKMGSGQLLAGHIASAIITAAAFLQIIAWPTAGYLVMGTVLLVTMAHISSRARTISSEDLTSKRDVVRKVEPLETNHAPVKKTLEQNVKSTAQLPSAVAETGRHTEEPSKMIGPDKSLPVDGPSRIAEGDYLTYDIKLEEGEEAVGEVACNGYVNVYVLNEENLNALELDQEFWYEAGNEGVQTATVRFTAPEEGEWFFVVENTDTRELEATVKVNVGKSPHSVPLLRTEGLNLPDARLDARLEGKL